MIDENTDTIAEFMSIGIGVVGLSYEAFMELTPLEFQKIYNKFNENRMKEFELHQVANYMGFGQANGGKKFKSVFKHKEQKSQRRVSHEEKMRDLADIQQRLKGVK